MPAPEPTNRPAPITPPRAIIDRWRCFRPWDREEPSAFGGVVTVVLDTRFVQCVDMGGTCGRIRRARGEGVGLPPAGSAAGQNADSLGARTPTERRPPTIRTPVARSVPAP